MSLGDVQRRLWRLIAWPEGVRAGLREEPPGSPRLSSLVRSDERLCAEDRLDVYANAYFYRIHDVLAEDFPTLAQALGAEDFHDLVTSYLAVHPSEHPSLRWIGDRLPGFLARSDAVASLRSRHPFGPDLAAYERATEAVFDAEEASPTSREDLAGLRPEDWDTLPIRLRPCVRVLLLEWPVHELRAAQRSGHPLPAVAARPTGLCVWRADEQVVHRELEPTEARALGAAAAGTAFGALCERIAEDVGAEEAPARAATLLERWVGDGLLG